MYTSRDRYTWIIIYTRPWRLPTHGPLLTWRFYGFLNNKVQEILAITQGQDFSFPVFILLSEWSSSTLRYMHGISTQ